MRGIWSKGYEESAFYPGRASPPTDSTPRPHLWLSAQPGAFSPEQEGKIAAICAEHCLLHLDFIGRRTSVEGHYGHMGMSKHILVIDRVLKAVPVSEPGNG
jgi:hypothetical protein